MTASTVTTQRQLSFTASVREAQKQCLRADPDIFLIGEDVATYGGAFGTSRGMLEEFGPGRIVDTPISEKAIVALAAGAAASGLRPIAEIMFMDFIGECMDELVNQLAKMRYMFGGTMRLPVTVRMTAGGGMGAAAQHSQNLEAWLCHVPGLKVVTASNPYDAKGLLVAAIRDDDPVVVIESKALLGVRGEVPEELYETPIGSASIARAGRDVTVVTYGSMVPVALAAAERLAAEGVEVEVVDLRTLSPMDSATVLESVRRTHRALVLHEAIRFGGLGAEIAAQIGELAFDYLDAPVARVGAPFSPAPYSPALERLYQPNAERLVAAVRHILSLEV